MGLVFSGKTDIGCVRKSNQDAIHLDEPLNLFLVADGMGGHQGGDIASAIAVDKIPECFRAQEASSSAESKIKASIKSANKAIIEKGSLDEKLKGMGTTSVLAHFQDTHMFIGNVGDSRCYLINNGNIYQLTSDHSLVQEKLNLSLLSGVYNYDREQAKNDPQGNVITRTIGFDEQVEIDVFKYQVKKNDFFILCSDGLHGKVTDERILEIFSQTCPKHEFTQGTLDKCTESLIEEAKLNGGNDNISVITIAAI